MPEPHVAAFRAETGFKPIDAVRYRQKATIDPYQHRDSDILLYRMIGCGSPNVLTQAERGSGEPDLLFMAYGTGHPAHGKVAGTPFSIAPRRTLRSTFIPRDIDTSVTFVASAKSVNLMFPNGYLDKLVEGERHRGLAVKLFSEDVRLANLIKMLEAEIAAPSFASHMLIEGLTRAIASILVQIDPERTAYDARRIYLPLWKLRRVDDFIEANLDRPIRLSDLADVAGLSVFHFVHVFKLATGSTPYHYLCARRIAYSCRLLAEDRLDIVEIAGACGFSSQSHFTSAFTKAMGISPGRYRRTMGVRG